MENNVNNNILNSIIENYLTKSKNVLNFRLQNIDLQVEDNLKEIENVKNQIININDSIFEEQEYLIAVNHIKEEISSIKNKINALQEEKKIIEDSLQERYDVLSRMIDEYYSKIYHKVTGRRGLDEVIGLVDNTINILNNRIYFSSIDTLPIKRKINELNLEIEEQEQTRVNQELKFADEVKEITNKYIIKFKLRYEKKIEFLKDKNQYLFKSKEDLTNTFKIINQRNVAFLEEKYQELVMNNQTDNQILEYLNDDISSFISSLEKQKSFEEERILKDARRRELETKLEEVKPLLEKYQRLNQQLESLKEKEAELDIYLKQIKDYHSSAMQILDQSNYYHEIYQNYSKLIVELDDLDFQIDQINNQVTDFERLKNNLILKSNSKEELEKLKDDLKSNKDLLKELTERKEVLNKELILFENDLDHQRIKKLYQDLKNIKDNIDDLTLKKQDLEDQIDELTQEANQLKLVYDESLKISEELKNYEN